MNWGKSIALAFILFASFILYLISRMVREQVDLIRPDYYVEEITYDSKLKKIKNTNHLDIKCEIRDSLNITFPNKISEVKILLFRPADIKKDLKYKFQNIFTISLPIRDLAKGKWILKVEWEALNKSHYYEKIITI